ncbi:MAG: diaminopimelate decarboxylase [Alphaproteobacteria bacterium]|nr:diaminopimelate decarboxylase [Alphaproteobacteria bacterium]
MNAFDYRNDVLCAEAVPLTRIAAEVGTPFYCYSTQQLQQNYRDFAGPFAGMKTSIYYAIKANANLAVMRALAACGAGADVTSAGELERALQAGVRPEKIVFNGVGKTRDEITAALLARIYQINAESIPELHLISRTAASLEKTAPVGLRINPDVDARTHKKTSTGHKETKFGIELDHLDEALRLASSLPGLELKGLMIHVGSHVHDYEPFREAYQKLADIVRGCRARGMNIDRVDLGGGVGIPYDGQTLAPFEDYAAIVRDVIRPLGCEVMFEPGRRLVGDAGILVGRAIHIKEGTCKKFLIIDAAMNDLVRPAMYGARHGLLPVAKKNGAAVSPVAVVGPICETSDLFGENYLLPPMETDDLVAILQAGAYGSAMASTYNGRALVPEVLVSGAQYAIIRRRLSVAEQIGWETLPSWMTTACAE